METRPLLKVSSDRLVKPGIEPTTPGLQGKQFIHKTTTAPIKMIAKLESTQKLKKNIEITDPQQKRLAASAVEGPDYSLLATVLGRLFVCLFDLIFYINNLSVIKGRVFLG